jgi:hypothetical protein
MGYNAAQELYDRVQQGIQENMAKHKKE